MKADGVAEGVACDVGEGVVFALCAVGCEVGDLMCLGCDSKKGLLVECYFGVGGSFDHPGIGATDRNLLVLAGLDGVG